MSGRIAMVTGQGHVHRDDGDVRGLYVTRLTFAHPGSWGIEVQARDDSGSSATARLTVTVAKAPQTPTLGSPAPRSRNLVASDVRDLRQIDTSPKPDPRLHQVRIADAIAKRKPQLVVFATPQFCTSRMCGPLDIVRQLLPGYNKRVAFSSGDLAGLRQQKGLCNCRRVGSCIRAVNFVVDGDGIIRAKFEGLVTARELEAALQQVLQFNPPRHH